jgi:hypothetical protein
MERQPMVDAAPFYGFLTLAQQGYAFISSQYTRTDVQRNAFAVHLLKSKYEWLLMLDSDHVHPADVVERLWQRVQQRPEIKIIGGLAFRRGDPYEPMAYIVQPNGTLEALIEPVLYDKPGVYEVDRIATCSLLIHRSVFETTPFPWFRYGYEVQSALGWPDCSLEDVTRTNSPSEDMEFCKLAKAAGHKIYVDTAFHSPHARLTYVGPNTFRQSFLGKPSTQVQLQLHKVAPELFAGPAADVLYVGARPNGCAYMQPLADAGHRITLLEAWPANAAHYRDDPRVANVIEGDVRTAPLPGQGFDYVFWWHGPEHIPAAELPTTLARLESAARKGVILGCPWGVYPQGEYGGNPYEPHVNTIYPEQLQDLGYETFTAGERDKASGNLMAWKAVIE